MVDMCAPRGLNQRIIVLDPTGNSQLAHIARGALTFFAQQLINFRGEFVLTKELNIYGQQIKAWIDAESDYAEAERCMAEAAVLGVAVPAEMVAAFVPLEPVNQAVAQLVRDYNGVEQGLATQLMDLGLSNEEVEHWLGVYRDISKAAARERVTDIVAKARNEGVTREELISTWERDKDYAMILEFFDFVVKHGTILRDPTHDARECPHKNEGGVQDS